MPARRSASCASWRPIATAPGCPTKRSSRRCARIPPSPPSWTGNPEHASERSMNPSATDVATDPWMRLLAAPETALADHPGSPKLRRADGFWLLRLDRPDEHNRLDPADVDALGAFFAQRSADDPQSL